MRTIVDIPKEHIKALDLIRKRQNLSRAELVRRAVCLFLKEEKKKKPGKLKYDIRGIAKPGDPRYFEGLDALEYERKIRSEWDHRDKMYPPGWAMHDAEQEPLEPPGGT